jgi:lipopolysaccharide export system protein LptC
LDSTPAAGVPRDLWEPQRRLSLTQARQRSEFVRVFRWACVGIAAAAASSVLIAMTLHALGGGFGRQGDVAVQETLTMMNPRFTGRDGDGSSYVITAATAVRQGPGSDVIVLDQPRFEGGNGRIITAKNGVYNPTAQTVDLKDDVVFTDPQGTRFTTATAYIDASQDQVRGDQPISGASRLGEVRADAYELRDNGAHVIMRGRVRGTIYGKARPAAESPPPGGN